MRSIVEMVPDLTKSKWWSLQRQSGGGITFAMDLQDVPDIEANETEMAQVLINLVHNAVDAMPEGGVISIQLREEESQIVIRVSDTGTGVSQDVVDRCFEPYVTTRSAGSGLGLSLCRRIVTDHNGTIELTEQVPRGSCFTIRLPISESVISKPSQDQSPQNDRRVLHIDNNATREDRLSNVLRTLGHHVDVVRSGDEGLRQFFVSEYDVVIAGFGLHPTSGFHVAQAIKRKSPGIPIAISLEATEQLELDNLPLHLQPNAFIRASDGKTELEQVLSTLGLWTDNGG